MSGRRSLAQSSNAVANSDTSKNLLHDLDDPLISQLHEYTNSPTQPISIPQPKNFGTLARRPSLSTSSQTSFGSFISAADHHPLQSPAHNELLPFSSSTHHSPHSSTSQRALSHHQDVHSPSSPTGLLGRFGEEAKSRSRENGNRLLKEIVEHEDDPLYWVDIDRGPHDLSPIVTSDSDGAERSANTKAESSTSSRPVSPNPLSMQNLLEEAMLIDLERASSESNVSSSASVLSSSPPSSITKVDRSRSSTPHPTSTQIPAEAFTESISSRSHSLSRSTSPSSTVPSSSVGSLSRSWVSSILGSASRFRQQHRSQDPSFSTIPSSASDSTSEDPTHHTHPEPQAQHTLPTILPSQIKQMTPQSLLHIFESSTPVEASSLDHPRSHAQPIPKHAKTVSSGSTIRQPTLTFKHGTPFGPHPFTGADGAPGFAGLSRKWNEHGFEYNEAERDSLKGVRLVGRKDVTVPVLTGELADSLRPHLPVLPRLSASWSLLYSLDQHGISIKTLYTRCALHAGTALIIIKDTTGDVFGACVSEGVHLSKRSSYYGTGDSFLWSQLSSQNLRVYKWTGKNEYVALCEPTFLSFGGGDGHYGLYIGDSLLDGTTNPCPTFGNEHLARGTRAGQSVRFECVGLEVWGVDM